MNKNLTHNAIYGILGAERKVMRIERVRLENSFYRLLLPAEFRLVGEYLYQTATAAGVTMTQNRKTLHLRDFGSLVFPGSSLDIRVAWPYKCGTAPLQLVCGGAVIMATSAEIGVAIERWELRTCGKNLIRIPTPSAVA